jgi:hypothetical protein
VSAWFARPTKRELDSAAAERAAAIEARHLMQEGPPQSETLFDAEDYTFDEPDADAGTSADMSVAVNSGGYGDVADVETEAGELDEELDALTPGAPRHVRRRRSRRSRRVGPASQAESGEVEPSASRPLVESVDVTETPSEPRPRGRFAAALTDVGRRALTVVLIAALLVAGTYGLAVGINAFARWNARRVAALNAGTVSPVEDNLLVIGLSDGVAVGFTALKAERANKRVLGIAIPDGAFMEVPGQGFERVGASYLGGPGVSKDSVSNYLGVPFRKYIVIDGAAYQTLLKDQNIAAVMSKVSMTDLTSEQRASFTEYFSSVAAKDVWIVPLPVKPVVVGDQQYFEPQRAQVADLLLQWWGVQPSAQKATPRVIVYNGVGTPGIAGLAAQQLIKAGLRVVDSGNADNFNHKQTLILVYHGTSADARSVRTALGVGRVVVQSAPQNLTDIIVVIGSDYRPPTSDVSNVPTEGVQ